MKVVHTSTELRGWRKSLPPGATLGFVPTMGALHAGHAKLLQHSRQENQHSVLSIFVNPAQFGPKEDLSKYPRTLDSDLAIAREMGVDLVFAPSPNDMYPAGFSTYVEESSVSKPLCGEVRPGHFRGVATVVLKLLHLTGPTRAYFGLKDAQQFLVIRKMLQDLDFELELVGVPTVRESDGLAMSSRNVYLSPEERQTAPRIHWALQETKQRLKSSSDLTAEALSTRLQQTQHRLTQDGFRVQYLDALTLPSLMPISASQSPSSTPLLLAVAAYLGTTRLIDNIFCLPQEFSLHDTQRPSLRVRLL